jgi:beta-mannosidase
VDLCGTWRARSATDELRRIALGLDGVDDDWAEIAVPGHWRDHPEFAESDGPVLYRRRFTLAPPESDRRRWVCLDGVFYQADVWLDGAYLGDPEGYFFPHTFDISALSRLGDDHVLSIEVTCSPNHSYRGRRNITGIFQYWDGIDRAWNPGGLWRPVTVFDTGPVHIERLRVICRDADESRAHLRLYARLDSDSPRSVRLRTSADGLALDESEHPLATGTNEIEWTLDIASPALWWPRSIGSQQLTTIGVEVLVGGDVSDRAHRRTGFREVAWNNWLCSVNAERIFLKGANLLPTAVGLANASPDEVRGDLELAVEAGLDVLRVHGHIADRSLYDAADEMGVLLLQDFPLQWEHARSVRGEAVRQAVEAVNLLGHHPSIVQWTGHNDPAAAGVGLEGSTAKSRLRYVIGQQLPSWNRSVLDRWVKRAFEKADPSRPTVAHSGVLPHLPQLTGTDSHWYFGWYHGDAHELAELARTVPRTVQFVSEFGAQAVPTTATFIDASRWPALDWEALAEHHGLQKWVFDERVPPSDYPTFDAWRDATQLYQAHLLRLQIETLRRLKYRPTGGFCFFALNDPAPVVSWSVLDHRRVPKLGYIAVTDACRPVLVIADPLPPYVNAGDVVSLDVHVVNDTRRSIEAATVDVVTSWARGVRRWRFAGEIDPDSVAKVGTINLSVPDTLGALHVDFRLSFDDDGHRQVITNGYTTAVTVPPEFPISASR